MEKKSVRYNQCCGTAPESLKLRLLPDEIVKSLFLYQLRENNLPKFLRDENLHNGTRENHER